MRNPWMSSWMKRWWNLWRNFWNEFLEDFLKKFPEESLKKHLEKSLNELQEKPLTDVLKEFKKEHQNQFSRELLMNFKRKIRRRRRVRNKKFWKSSYKNPRRRFWSIPRNSFCKSRWNCFWKNTPAMSGEISQRKPNKIPEGIYCGKGIYWGILKYIKIEIPDGFSKGIPE